MSAVLIETLFVDTAFSIKFKTYRILRKMSYTYNGPTSLVAAIVTIQITLSILGILLNIMLLYAHKKDPCKLLRSSSTPFIVNIAVNDLLACCWFLADPFIANFYFDLVPISPAQLTSDILYTCLLLPVSISFVSYLSLSFERFFSVAFPLWHRVRITTRVTRYWLAAIWIITLTSEGVLLIILIYRYEFQWLLCKFIFSWAAFLLTQIMYFASYISLRKQRNGLYKRQDLSEVGIRMIHKRLENENNFLKTIALVCFVLAFTLLPCLTVPFVFLLCSGEWTLLSIENINTYWGIAIMNVNFAINLPIYLWRMKKYRITFKKLYCKF